MWQSLMTIGQGTLEIRRRKKKKEKIYTQGRIKAQAN